MFLLTYGSFYRSCTPSRSVIEDWKRDLNEEKGSLFGPRHSSKRILIYMLEKRLQPGKNMNKKTWSF